MKSIITWWGTVSPLERGIEVGVAAILIIALIRLYFVSKK